MKKPIAARSALKQPAAKRPVEQVMKNHLRRVFLGSR